MTHLSFENNREITFLLSARSHIAVPAGVPVFPDIAYDIRRNGGDISIGYVTFTPAGKKVSATNFQYDHLAMLRDFKAQDRFLHLTGAEITAKILDDANAMALELDEMPVRTSLNLRKANARLARQFDPAKTYAALAPS